MHAPFTSLPTLLACLLAGSLLPVTSQAAGYKFTSYQYPGADETYFSGVDDTNRIVGYAEIGGNAKAILLTSAGSVTTINMPGYLSVFPTAINRLGGVVGNGWDGLSYSMLQDNSQGFGQFTGAYYQQEVTGINASFNIAGTFTNTSNQPEAYALINGTYHLLLPAQKCQYTFGPAINDSNEVAGSCATASNVIGFKWSKGSYTYFQPPAGSTYLQPTAIDKSGVIAGFYVDATGLMHGFVLNGATFTTVDYNEDTGANTQILGMNNAGKLVGTHGSYPGITAFIATPK